MWAVGKKSGGAGVVLHFEGTTWTEVPELSGRAFVGVCGTTSRDVWLYGNGFFHWDGSTWSDRSPPGRSGAVGCSATGPKDVWFPSLGVDALWHWDGAALSVVDFGGTEALAAWARTPTDVWVLDRKKSFHWDGTTWSEVPFDRFDGERFGLGQSIMGVAPDDVWALYSGNPFHWDGHQWKELPRFAPVDEFARGALWAAGGSIWMVGTNGAILRRR